MKKILTISLSAVALVASASLLSAASAQENWDNLCAKCHGADGAGQTKIGKKLKVKDYTDAKSIAEHSDADLAKDIADGVKRDGKEVMKPFKDELKPDEITALVAHIHSFAKK